MRQQRLLGEGSGRPEVGDAHAPLEIAAARDDLAPDRLDRLARQRPRIAGAQPGEDLRLALGTHHRRVVVLLPFADALRQARALGEPLEQLAVDAVDLRAQRVERFDSRRFGSVRVGGC